MTLAHDLFEQRCHEWSDIWEHLKVMHDFVVDGGYQTVVELGVRSGNSTSAFLAAVEKTDGHLWSVDVEGPPRNPAFDDHERWTFLRGDDLSPAVYDFLPDLIDVLFIDTSHMFRQTLEEMMLYGGQSKHIFLHDTELARPMYQPQNEEPYPVKRAVTQWCDAVGRTWTNRTNCYGLGHIYP